MKYHALLLFLLAPAAAAANPPVASYIFPAGGQRGTKVDVRVGGLFLYEKCGFEMLGPGVHAPAHLERTKTIWFEGPLLQIPDSQRQEDYPKDMAGAIAIAGDAPLGLRTWRLWTSQGATGSMKFIVGELPEIIEDEIDGDPLPVKVTLPVTINGRIFPREDIDIYTFRARKNQTIRCEVNAARLGSPLDARLEVRDAQGRRLAEADAPSGGDPLIVFTAPADGEYQVRIQDANLQGGQAYVYRLTLSAEPFVQRFFPLGGRRGHPLELQLFGHGVPASQRLAIPKDAPVDYAWTPRAAAGKANPILLDTDEFPEFIAPADVAKIVSPPAMLNGKIGQPGQIDEWTWQGKKGQTWEFALRAARLGSKLDGVVTVTDAAGKKLMSAEAGPGDPRVSFQVPADGEYRVRIQDRFVSRGGADFAYRLRIAAPPPPDFLLTMAADPRNANPGDAVTVPRKGTAKMRLNVERVGGLKEPIALEVKGLAAGVTVTPSLIQPNQAAVDLTFKADEKAKIDVARITIVGTAKGIERTARLAVGRGQPEQASVLLAVALPTPFVIKGEYDMGFGARGTVHKRKYKIIREGYDGPIEISLADRQARHLQGVEAGPITVPAGVSEFTYAFYLPPWMETGRTCRVCVQGVATITDTDGSKHRVSYSSVNQNEQLVTVVGPGMLALEAERTSFTAAAGQSIKVPVRIQRGLNVAGPVELSLIVPAHLKGIAAEKATIPAKAERGELVIRCADTLPGPFNMPLVLRATLMHQGAPLVAEAKLDVQP